MTARSVDGSGMVRLSPAADARLVPYCIVALGGLTASLVTGQTGLAVLAIPFALALGIGLQRTGRIAISARVVLHDEQVLEGDVLTGRIELEWDGTFDAQVRFHRLRGVEPLDDAAVWGLPSAGPSVTLPLRLRAARWGRHTVGEVWVRLEKPLGLFSWTGKVAIGPVIRVLPTSERLTRMLDPSESRAVLGQHRSKRIGDGYDFAEIRPYVPGDRLRDLNWSATARHQRPFVNRRHPERSGDVVIALDAFADSSVAAAEGLARAARAAWALASVHLRANDRVGLAGLSGNTRWLPPAGGRRAQYRLLETLLRIGGDAADLAVPRPADRRTAVPASALIIALTPLHSRSTIAALESWRARGRSVAVLLVDTTDVFGAPISRADKLAWRLWRVEIERRKRELARLGIPVVTARGDEPVAPVIAALRRACRAPSLRRP